MYTSVVYIIGSVVVLAFIGLASLRQFNFGARRVPLVVYLMGVAAMWAVVLGLSWFVGGSTRLNLVAMVCFGFAVGMLAMYIAVHVYES